jgi:hypothetical protein
MPHEVSYTRVQSYNCLTHLRHLYLLLKLLEGVRDDVLHVALCAPYDTRDHMARSHVAWYATAGPLVPDRRLLPCHSAWAPRATAAGIQTIFNPFRSPTVSLPSRRLNMLSMV